MKKFFPNILTGLFLVLFLAFNVVKADDLEGKLKEQLPALLGTNNAGTTFYMTFHPCWEETGPNNAIRIYVSAAVGTAVTLVIDGIGKKIT